MLPSQPNQSLIDGLACLQALTMRRESVGVSELAAALSLEVTRTHRLLRTLAYLGLTRQGADRRYTAGPAIHILSAQSMIASGLLRQAGKHLAELQHHGYTVALGVRWKSQVCYLYHALPQAAPAESFARPDLYPATKSSIGMVLLAARPQDEVSQLYAEGEIPGYPRGIHALLDDLAKIREQGFARVIKQSQPLDATLAVPVGSDPYAAVAMSGHITARAATSLLPILKQAAAQINSPSAEEAQSASPAKKKPARQAANQTTSRRK